MPDTSRNIHLSVKGRWALLAGTTLGLAVGALVFGYLNRALLVGLGPLLIGGSGSAALAIGVVLRHHTSRLFFVQAWLLLVGMLMYLPLELYAKGLAAVGVVLLWKWGVFDRAMGKVLLVIAPLCIGLAVYLLAFEGQAGMADRPNFDLPAKNP
jgi:hypothetical protein